MMIDETGLLALVHNIFENCGVRVRLEGFDVLRDDKIYFEMCKILFPEDSIKLLKISESRRNTGQKIQALLDYISRTYDVNISHISGDGIARGSIKHIHHMLEFFQSISNELRRKAVAGGKTGVRSARESVEDPDNDGNNFQTHSVLGINRQFRKDPVYSDENADDSDQEEEASEGPPREDRNHPAPAEEAAEDQMIPKTLKDEIITQIKEVQEEFRKLNKVDNRKERNDDLREIKNKYKSYLKEMIVDKKVESNIEEIREARKPARNKTMNTYYVRKEQQEIELQQNALGVRLRDGKARQLRRIKQIVQNLERKRLADERKDQLLMEREIDQNTKLKMASLVNKHERTMGVLRERTQEQRQLYANRERENIQLVAESHRRLKQQYKSQRNKLRSSYQQQQRRLLDLLEDDGALERLIVDIYKRY